MPAIAPRDNLVLIAIRRESWLYTTNKPGKVPPADSPNRPYLAMLWNIAHDRVRRRPNARTFVHANWRFGIARVGTLLYVFDWQTRDILVRSPSSLTALRDVLGRRCEG